MISLTLLSQQTFPLLFGFISSLFYTVVGHPGLFERLHLLMENNLVFFEPLKMKNTISLLVSTNNASLQKPFVVFKSILLSHCVFPPPSLAQSISLWVQKVSNSMTK